MQSSGQSESKTLYFYWSKRLHNYLSIPEQQKSIPTKLLQKLQIIEKSIMQEQITQSTYPSLDQEELDQLLSHSEDVKITLYMSIAKMFLKDDVVGKIDIRSESKLFWNTKDMKLDFNQKSLQISKKSKASEFHSLQLSQYKAKWIGGSKKMIFELILVNEKDPTNKFKNVTFGDEDQVNSRQWFDCIKICCQSFEDDQVDKKQKIRNSVTMNEPAKTLLQSSQISSETGIDSDKKPLKIQQTSSVSPTHKKTDKLEKSGEQSGEKKVRISVQPEFAEKRKSLVPEVVLQVPFLFQSIVQEGTINKVNLLSDINFKLMHFQKNLRILQHTENPNHFKALLLLDMKDPASVIQSLVSVEEQMKWNQQIEQSSKNLTILHDSQTLVIYEARKKYGRLYLGRDFVLMRHVIKNESGLFILEKSTTHEEYQPSMNPVRGEIYSGVWGLFEEKNQNQALLVYSINQTNGGYSSAHQDSAMTVNYLLQLENLEQYLKQQNFQSGVGVIPRYLAALFDNPVEQQVENESKTQLEQNKLEESASHSSSYLSENSSVHDQSELIQDAKTTDYIVSQQANESTIEYLKRLLKEVDCFANEIWYSAIHQFETGQIDQLEPKLCNDNSEYRHYMLKGEWEAEEKGGFKFINLQKLAMQKDVFKFLLKKMGANLIAGKSLMSVSMPVYIFEKRSNLERHAYQMSFAPVFLEKAAKMTNPIDQMKEVVKFGLSACLMYMSMDKPFNPILGETFQGRLNGSPVYCEQISHHPPICSFYIVGRGYNLYGHLEIQAQMGANSVTGVSAGFLQVDFLETGNSIQFNTPPGYIAGITFGDRMFYIDGVQWFIDTKNLLLCELNITVSQGMFTKRKTPVDYVDGKIMIINEKEVERFQKETYKKYVGSKGEITGRYTQNLFFDQIECLDWDKVVPYQLEYEVNPLASDSKYRDDLIAWQMDDIDLAQEKKEKLEVFQRNDKKQRDKLGPKKKKH